jgi:hypothetical protein
MPWFVRRLIRRVNHGQDVFSRKELPADEAAPACYVLIEKTLNQYPGFCWITPLLCVITARGMG